MRRLSFVVLLSMAATSGWSQTFETTPGWIRPDGGYYGSFGLRVAMLDADGNGYADVAIAGPFYTPSSPSTTQYGAVLFYPGSTSGLPDWYTWFEVGPETGTTLGFHLAAGDINGDGYDDLVFSSGSGFGNGTSRVHVRFGSAGGPDLRWNFDTGSLGDAYLGPTLAVGDLNRDGFDDVVAGFNKMNGDSGRLMAFYGSQSGLPAVPDWEKAGSVNQHLGHGMTFVGDLYDEGYGNLLVCDYSHQLMIFRGSATGLEDSPSWTHTDSQFSCFDSLPSAVGDVNGDGFDDFAVGVQKAGPSGNILGVQIFCGSAAGPVAQLPLWLEEDSFGWSFASAGDMNGDGFSDLVVGAPWEDDAGKVYLLMGSPVGIQPQPVWSSELVPDSKRVGSSVASGGDVNGDGLTDLVAGDPGGMFWNHGRGQLFHGFQPFASGPAGRIYSNSSTLRFSRNPAGHVVLSWGPSCAGHEEDYAIYRGSLGDFDSHLRATCSTNGSTTWAAEIGSGDQYYLVVPRTLDAEGSYGTDSQGNERSPLPTGCLPQSLLGC